MAGKVEFGFVTYSEADVETVLGILDDVDHWAQWARPLLMQAQWERWGEGSVGGPGAVRRLGAWPMWIRETVLTRGPRGHTYTVVSPPSFTHYLGTVDIADRAGGGVDISWRIEFTARQPFLAPVLEVALKKVISGLLTRLAAEAADRAHS